MKQIAQVLRAVRNGATTSRAVVATSGLPIKQVCYWLRELERAGMIERTGRKVLFPGNCCWNIVWRPRSTVAA